MIKALKIRKGTALVSTRGLRRVVLQPSGKVICELETLANARVFADAYNSIARKARAEVVKYPQ